MTNKKIGPYILLGVLILILFFTLGVKLGQKVEKTNKKISYVLSLTPTLSPPTPTVTQNPLQFATYQSKLCGIKFLYPKNLSIKDSSSSATFKEDTDLLTINCGKIEKDEDPKVATAEVTFKNKKITVKKNTEGDNTLLIFNIKNPLNAKTISVKIDENLYPLFENTLQFISN